MRKVLISVAAAASALAFAAPASAQYYPAPPPPGYGYGYGYGNDYGYNNNYGSARVLQGRIDRVQRQIRELDQRNLLTNRQAAERFQQSRIIERQLRNLSRNGLSRREFAELDRGIRQFEQQIWRDTNNGRGWGHNDDRRDWRDRDRDGRNDRWEDDRGRDRDGRWDRDDD